MSGVEGGSEFRKSNIRCRIPQRTFPNRGRTNKPKSNNIADPAKSKGDKCDNNIIIQCPLRRGSPRPRSAEIQEASRSPPARSPQPPQPQVHPVQMAYSTRLDWKTSIKRPLPVSRKTYNDTYMKSRPGKQVITIPNTSGVQKQASGKRSVPDPETVNFGLPDQETISKCEEQRMQRLSSCSNNSHLLNLNEEGLLTRSEQVMRLKGLWQEKIDLYENKKVQLGDLQRTLLELYATLRLTYKEMAAMGQKVKLPPSEDLRIMNVAKLSPDQLLQICENRVPEPTNERSGNVLLNIDVNLLYAMPAKIVATCEQTLNSRCEIVFWFEEVMAQKEITKNAFSRKVEQFKLENNMFKCNLDSNKQEFTKNINEAVELLKKSVNGAVINQIRNEELICKLSELSSTNEDLRKQLRIMEGRIANRTRLEELEKELKDEKCKRMVLRERLSRAEGHVKQREEKIVALEAAWEQANGEIAARELTAVQLREENQRLQSDFDDQLKALTESIRQNSQHLEEIAVDREKLQTEKEDLERRLSELSEHYSEAIANLKKENAAHISVLVETEKKYQVLLDEKKELESKVEAICGQLIDSESNIKELTNKLCDAEHNFKELKVTQQEIEILTRQLQAANCDLQENKKLTAKQESAMLDVENNFKKAVEAEEMLKSNLNVKEEYIFELEKQRSLLESRLRESEFKMESYAAEISDFQKNISQMQKEFGGFKNLEDLHKMVNEQRAELQTITEEKNSLVEELKKKEVELAQHLETLTEQGLLVEQREAVIRMLSEKDEEQTNIITLLRNNLEIRAQADSELNQQIIEKNTEIDSLISNVETRKEQICQLENIILTLEEQSRKASIQKRKDREAVMSLEKKVAEYESYYVASTKNLEPQTDNLDHLINILENELGGPFEGQLLNKGKDSLVARKSAAQKKRERNNFACDENKYSSVYQSPTKIVMGNYVKKTYIPNEEARKSDKLNRKKAITSMETPKWFVSPESGAYSRPPPPSNRDKQFRAISGDPTADQRNTPYLCMPNDVDEKKSKMFKFAGHRMA